MRWGRWFDARWYAYLWHRSRPESKVSLGVLVCVLLGVGGFYVESVVGSALMATAIEWSRAQGLHKLSLSVFAHNEAAIGLYRKFGFVEEGCRIKQYRRQSGELWDTVEMGLLL